MRVADVACRAPRHGPGAEEGGERLELVLPRRGVFAVHRGCHSTVADANSVLLLGGGEHRVSHPVAGGDDCTALLFAPELLEEALGARPPARQALLSPRAQLLRSALPASADPLAGEETALERLAAGETGLARLAVELGFAHHSHFSARFRAAFVMAPSEARKIVTAGARAAS